jgi:hypothetical protein
MILTFIIFLNVYVNTLTARIMNLRVTTVRWDSLVSLSNIFLYTYTNTLITVLSQYSKKICNFCKYQISVACLALFPNGFEV